MHIFGLNSQILIVSSEHVQAHNSHPPPLKKGQLRYRYQMNSLCVQSNHSTKATSVYYNNGTNFAL